jgi:hypothetical protein
MFIPKKHHHERPAMIVEFKWDETAEIALTQIHIKEYPEVLEDFSGGLLLVGISYDKKSREHVVA